jgi:hypothetical protein
MTNRNWERIAELHLTAYQAAMRPRHAHNRRHQRDE